MSLEEKVGFLDKVVKKGKKVVSYALMSSMLLTGVFSCGKKDVTSPDNPPFQTEIGISNEEGIVNFEDGRITVLDDETQEPVENITVSNFNGEDYNVVTPHDVDYFPLSGLFNNITDETLFIHEKVEIGYERYVKKELNSTEKNICSKFLNHLDNLPSRDGAYKKTISGNEAIYSYYAIEGILYFTGWESIMQIVGNVNRFFNEEGDDLQTYIYENNWDKYEFDHPAGFDGKIYYTVPSNQPELNLEAIVGNNDGVEMQFSTFDKFYYEELDFQDATITDRGPTSDNDLLIGYEVFQNGGTIYSNSLPFSSNSESNTKNISLTLSNGSYEIEVKLFDDTFYKEIFQDSGINQSQINTNFNVGGSSPEGEILFVRDNKIYKINADGAGLEQLTNDYYDYYPHFNTINNKIIFGRANSSQNGIYSMDENGQNIELFVPSPYSSSYGHIKWNPDGDKIVCKNEDTNYIDLIDWPGGSISPLVYGSYPCFKPDGEKILFTHFDGYNHSNIFTMDIDGTNCVQLTSGETLFDPEYSPDENKIVYVKVPNAGSSIRDIWVMDSDGTNSYHLTNNNYYDMDPSWNNAGDKIVFRRCLYSSFNYSDLYIISVNGTNEIQLTNSSSTDKQPVWKGQN